MKNTLKFITLLVLIPCFISYCANTGDEEGKGKVSGTIYDNSTDEVISNATVTLSNGTNTSSNTTGQYLLNNIQPGVYSLTAISDGFQSTTLNITIYENKTVQQNIFLTPDTGNNNNNNNNIEGLTIASYNVLDFSRTNAYDDVADFVSQKNVDILLLQEVQTDDEDAFSAALNTASASLQHVEFATLSYGADNLACFSKYPISNVSSILTGTYEDPISGNSYSMSYIRPIFRFRVTANTKTIWFYVAHLKAGSATDEIEQRRAQSYALEQYIMNTHSARSELIVIAGDMNTTTSDDLVDNGTLGYLTLKSDSDDTNDFISVNYELIPSSYTYGSSKVLDHIILSPVAYDLYISNSVEVPILDPYNKPSDHNPIILSLDIQ